VIHGTTCRPEASQSCRAAHPGSCPRTFFSHGHT
jgi:hypothetical protein